MCLAAQAHIRSLAQSRAAVALVPGKTPPRPDQPGVAVAAILTDRVTRAVSRAGTTGSRTGSADAAQQKDAMRRSTLARALGVRLGDGRVFRAPVVAANVNPHLLYTHLVPADALPGEFLARIRRWRCGS